MRVENNQPLSSTEILYILQELAIQMNILWDEYKIAVCDLKGENVLLSLTEMGAGYYIKIADLGGAYIQTSRNRDGNVGYPSCSTKVYYN